MRVERLELTGIGPFRETQVIDFATLSQSGLFLIDGPTGAGKTTIIDAIVFALFSGLSGENSSKERIRSDHSLASEKSEVVLDFSVRGRRHRITRSPGYQVAKPGGDGFTARAAKQSLIEFNPDGTAKTTLTSAADIGSHISALLNMQAAQFRQLVVLAQGEFAALLRMKPKERLEALRGLLGTQFFRDLQNHIYEQGQESKQVLAQSRKKLDDIATRAATFINPDNAEKLDPLLTTLLAPDTAAEDSLSAFDSFISIFEFQENSAGENHKAAQSQLKPIEIEFTEITQLHSSLSALRQARAELLEAEFRLDPLDAFENLPNDSEIVAMAQSLTLEAGALEPFIEWENSTHERQMHHASLKDDLEKADNELSLFVQEFESLPVRLKELRDQVSREPELRVKYEASTDLQKSLSQRLEKVDELGKAQTTLQTQAEEYRVARGEFDAGELAVERARTIISNLAARRLEQQVAVLAQTLIPGQPCSVCGSIDHPAPANWNESHDSGEFVTEANIAKAEKNLKSFLKDRDDLKEKLDAVQERLSASELIVAELKGAVGDKTAADLGGELAAISIELGEIQDQLAIVGEQATELTTLEEELSNGEKRINELREARNRAEANLATHEKQAQSMIDNLQRVIGEHSTALQTRDALLNRAASLTNLAQKLRVVRDLEKDVPDSLPSFDDIDIQFKALREQLEEAEAQVQAAAGVLAVATSQLSKVRDLAADFGRQLKTDAKLHTSHETRIRLAGLVTAQSSQNIKKLPLESYALQLRFQHVLEAASHHLDKMSAGRLSFVLDEDSQSNALAGLGIDVLDSWTGETRSPQTLSGGETFYASLALALGLADVVQAETGGVSLETLFVDEGFGSLDQESLQLVLDQLDQLKSGGRVIGVISHVSEMKDRFPERIVVQPQADGTSVVVRGN